MKKVCLSIGAIMLSGLVLASCSLGSGSSVKKLSISKPKDKGNSVSEINTKVMDYSFGLSTVDLNIKSDDKFEDVLDALPSNINGAYTREQSDSGVVTSKINYKKNSSTDVNATQTNKYYKDEIYKKYSTVTNMASTSEAYMKHVMDGDKLSIEGYNDNVNSTESSETFDSLKAYSKDYSQDKIAGYYKEDSSSVKTREAKVGTFELEEEKTSSKTGNLNDEKSNKKSVYKYVNDKETEDDDDYGYQHYGYKDLEMYEYEISDFQYNLMAYPEGVDLDTYFETTYAFDEEYKDYFDYSFELTDKYVILKGSYTFSEMVVPIAQSLLPKDATDAQLVEKVKSLLNKECKGTKTTFELWFDYTKPSMYSEDIYDIQCVYAKKESTSKINLTATYDDNYFNSYVSDSISDEIKDKIKGTKYTLKATIKEASELIFATDEDYSNKISKFLDKCEKNNIFKDMIMHTAN